MMRVMNMNKRSLRKLVSRDAVLAILASSLLISALFISRYALPDRQPEEQTPEMNSAFQTAGHAALRPDLAPAEAFLPEPHLLSRSSLELADVMADDQVSDVDRILVSQAAESERLVREQAALFAPVEQETEPPSLDDAPKQLFEPADYICYVAVSALNLRDLPTTGSDIADQLIKGDKLECVAVGGEWLKVRHGGRTGYLMAGYTSRDLVFRDVNETMYVESGGLNVRADVSTDAAVLTVLEKETAVTRIGVADGWSMIRTASGHEGYVVSGYLTSEKPFVPTPTPTPTRAPTPAPTKAPTAAPAADENREASKVSENELELFSRIVALEGDSKYGYEGYLAVATVILNRVESRRFPGSITGVLSQSGQFSTYSTTRKPYYNDSQRRAVQDALAGKRNLPNYILFFATPSAYERSVASGGGFSKVALYDISYGHAWCYYPSDRP